MDPSRQQAEDAEVIVRAAVQRGAAVGSRLLTILFAQLDKERADHKRLLAAYWEQEYALYLASSGGETGSNPPPPIAPPADAAKMLAPDPAAVAKAFWAPLPGELCPDDHDMWTNDDGSCGACEMLRSLKA